jgi:hypothetical protein
MKRILKVVAVASVLGLISLLVLPFVVLASDVGAAVIDRSGTWTGSKTYIYTGATCPSTMTVTSVEIWAETNMTDVKVGSFYLNGGNYTARNSTTLGTVTAGSKQTFTGLSFAMNTDDVLGIYFTGGALERNDDGGGAYYVGDGFTGNNYYNSTTAQCSIKFIEGITTPTVTVQAVTSVDTTLATGNGNITNLNLGGNCTVRGFVYDTDSGTVFGDYAYEAHDTGTYGTGAYTKALTSLTANTTYYIRAYATNSGGTSLSTETTFHTSVADAYWVGASGNWSDATTHWAESDGGAANAEHLPTAGTNVHFTSLSGFIIGNKTVTNNVAPYCNNMDWTGSPNTPIWAMSNQTSYIYGSITLSTGMTATGNAGINFVGTSSQTITTNGVVCGDAGSQWTINGVGGVYTLQDNLTLLGTLLVNNGTLDTNDKTVTVQTFSISGTNIRTADLGSSIINVSQAWTATTITSLTLTEGTSSIRLTSTASFSGGGETYYEAQFNGTSHTISGANTFTNLTRTGTATKTDSLTLSANQTVTGVLTLNGNSAINRVLIQSNTPATRRTITANGTISASNVDFLDIYGAGSASWDLSAATGGSGNVGNNVGITFTPADDSYWVDNNGSWSDITHWSSTSDGTGGIQRVPLVQDNAIFDANSITIDSRVVIMDMPRIGNFDCEDVARLPQFDGDGLGGGTVNLYGDIIIGDINFTPTTTNMYGRSTQEVWSNGEQFDSNINLYNYDAVWHIEDNFITTGIITLYAGTINMQGLQINCNQFVSTDTTYTRSLAWQAGTIYLTYASPSWNVAAANFTIGTNAGTTTFHPVSGNATFTSGSLTTYNAITIEGSTNYSTTVSGNFTCNTLTIDRSLAAKTLTGNITITLNTALSIPTSGVTVVTITNTDFSKASGTVYANYLNFNGGANTSTAAGGATFFCGITSITAPQTGWSFTDPTSPTLDTNSATNQTMTTATLNGDVDAMGTFTPLYIYYQYSLTGAYTGEELETPEQTVTIAGSYPANITGLTPDDDYYYRIVARYNTLSYTYGDSVAFNTSGKPVVETGAASSISMTDASISGTLLSLGIYTPIDVWFEWGETVAYGSLSTKVPYIAVGNFSMDLDGLQLNTTYHYRANADYIKDGTRYTVSGADATFTTLRTTAGSVNIQVLGGAVFKSYMATNDLLFTALVLNTYPPYYGTVDPSDYFVVQLLNPAGTKVLGATPLRAWGESPVSIYFSANTASSITWGGAYIIRMVGTFSTPPTDDYTLTSADWKGSDLTYLDKWLIASAKEINVYDNNKVSNPYTINVATYGELLTIAGGAPFTTAITNLMAVRPSIFEVSSSKLPFTAGTASNTYDSAVAYNAQVGTIISDDATAFGNVFGINGKTFLSLGFWILYLAAVVFVFFNKQGAETPVVLILCIPLLLFAQHLRIISIQTTVVAGAFAALLFVRKMWWSAT